MPAYNSEKYIEKSIQSVLRQSHKNLELIIINDGSIDRTKTIIQNLQKHDKRISYYEIKNSGSAVARNVGLEKARGEYLAFVDSDDYIAEKMFETLITYSKKYNSDIVSCSYEWVYSKFTKPEKTYLAKGYYDKSKLIKEIYPEILSTKSLNDKIPKTMWTKIFRKDLITRNKIRFTPELKMSQDLIFSIKCLLTSNSFYYLPDDKFYKYISNENSRTNTYLENAWPILKSNSEQLELISKRFSEYNLNSQLPYALLRNAMTAIANIGKNKDLKRQRNELKNILNDIELRKALIAIDPSELNIIRKLMFYLIKYKKVNFLMIALRLNAK